MPNFNDISGKTFFRLTVLSRAENINKKTAWLCLCSCGKEKIIAGRHLVGGKTRSCGCLSVEIHSNINTKTKTTHGMSTTLAYKKWQGMKTRCLNKNYTRFRDYGGRGIYICDEWATSFEAFYSYMGDPPTTDHSIDRIDNDGPYAPWNCKWSTPKEQSLNRRNTLR